MKPDLAGALQFYQNAADFVCASGFESEVEWQRNVELCNFDETTLLREAAWVVLCSGFSEAAVRRNFSYVSFCFCDWESAEAIVAAGRACSTAAMAAFRNEAKLKAILTIAGQINTTGFTAVRADILADPIPALRRFPFIGPVTAKHLAKNLGVDCAKPDRHLVRTSARFGFVDPDRLCAAIAAARSEQIKVVDLVIWRFLASGERASR
jgi:hypothetical protein